MKTDATSLDKLHDIIVPAPVPWWPPAPGWYWVLGFTLVALLALLLRWLIHWQQNRYRREALAVLSEQVSLLAKSDQSTDRRAASLLTLAELLKRTAVTAFPRDRVATLTGRQWFEFLDQTGRGTSFVGGAGARLEDAVYRPQTANDLTTDQLHELTEMIRRWIDTHQTESETTARTLPPTEAMTSSC
ncbi:DUF4381 domain-containing protein [Stieleria sp. TO1_6]|uniref:DUF4381 domain-containing protein n=1 Tax=Stieleria tagensis TaxID=2956795 RepID=UPI00209B1464|nr:DUF4381 domain-containing protein [Stieleria tagensis]MCO8120770.1 DUF4381 domain-containing protein [Stieleria tagensis]